MLSIHIRVYVYHDFHGNASKTMLLDRLSLFLHFQSAIFDALELSGVSPGHDSRTQLGIRFGGVSSVLKLEEVVEESTKSQLLSRHRLPVAQSVHEVGGEVHDDHGQEEDDFVLDAGAGMPEYVVCGPRRKLNSILSLQSCSKHFCIS